MWGKISPGNSGHFHPTIQPQKAMIPLEVNSRIHNLRIHIIISFSFNNIIHKSDELIMDMLLIGLST